MNTFFIIYETTNLLNGKKYRGQHITDNLNDGYVGSGKAFKGALRKYGRENFKVEILEYCSDADHLNERESHYVDEEWVIRNDTYNLQTGGGSQGRLCDESRQKISQSLKEAYASGKVKSPTGPTGKPAHNQGIPMGSEQKEKISKTLKRHYKENIPYNKGIKTGKPAWNRGLSMGPRPEEVNKRSSDTLKALYKTKEHHRKGKAPWNVGLVNAQDAWNKGIPADKFTCPHCAKEVGGLVNFNRWHNENCKFKQK